MQLQKICNTTAYVLLSGAVASGLTLLFEKFLRSREKKTEVECMFFAPCDMHSSRVNYPCLKTACPLCNFTRLCALLRTARDNLDVCMYLVTEPELANIIIRLFKRGVRVRIITDKQMSEESYRCKTGLFAKHQVPMRYVEARGMMHNKFIIIDRKIVITGSCNWTQHGFTNNYENAIIVRDEQVSKQYGYYFNNLWCKDRFK